MKIYLDGLTVDSYFLLMDLMYKFAKLHDPDVARDMLPYVVKLTKFPDIYEIVRQNLRVAIVTVVEKSIATFEFEKWDWGKEFERWVSEELVTNPVGPFDAFFVKR